MNRVKMQILFWVMLTVGSVFASKQSVLDGILDEYPDEMETIVMYPLDVRLSIFEITQYPALLIRINDLQEITHQRFENLIKDFDRSDQEDIYELLRYPDLVNELVENDVRSAAEVHDVLENYPDDIYDVAFDWGLHRMSDLKSVRRLDQRTVRDFDRLLHEYPQDVQDLAEEMINVPEVVSILTDDIEFTIALGDLYHDNTDWLLGKADSLNFVYAQQNAQELADYQESLEEDPDAYEEMREAARQYGDDYNVNVEYEPDPQIVQREVVYVYRPYAYWYGYPHWYTVNYWRPVPWYYESGFYFGPSGRMVIFGLPSVRYVHWHCYRHPSYYPHLTQHYYVHYKRYPHSHNHFHRAVYANIEKNTHVTVNRNVNVKQRNYHISDRDYKRPDTKRSYASFDNRSRVASSRYRDASRATVTERQADSHLIPARTSRTTSDTQRRTSRNSTITERSSNSRDMQNTDYARDRVYSGSRANTTERENNASRTSSREADTRTREVKSPDVSRQADANRERETSRSSSSNSRMNAPTERSSDKSSSRTEPRSTERSAPKIDRGSSSSSRSKESQPSAPKVDRSSSSRSQAPSSKPTAPKFDRSESKSKSESNKSSAPKLERTKSSSRSDSKSSSSKPSAPKSSRSSSGSSSRSNSSSRSR